MKLESAPSNAMETPFTIRPAERADIPLLLDFIRELAEYERLADEVSATEDVLERTLFGEPTYAEALLGYAGETPVGFAIFFHNFSTFLGKPGLYLEDLYVKPDHRGNGYGRAMLRHLAQLAVERDCGRFEWAVLDWNVSAIQFYRCLGARPMEDWLIYRLDGDALQALADESTGPESPS